MVEQLAKRDCLLILNYHRIGNREAETFDELVYNATEEEFTRQVKYLNQEFGVVTLKDALAFVSGEKSFGQPGVLLTFDDGYIDNYRAAFPILKSLGLEGTFFLVSDYLTRPIVPWWDKIAYLVRNTEQDRLILSYPRLIDLQLPEGRRAREIRIVLDLFKSPDTTDPERFLAEIESACEPCPTLPQDCRLFLNTDEALEMVNSGMAIGSHTKSHRILSKLSSDEQLVEVSLSRSELSRQLNWNVDTLAYPVGSRAAFDRNTIAVLQRTSYRAAFSFYGGINTASSPIDRFDVRRIDAYTTGPFSRFRLQIAGAVASGGKVF